jgi:ribosomal protein S18 acetylase RimI-like enzyme
LAGDGVRLRSAHAGDLQTLAALGRDSFTAAFGHLYRGEDLAAFLGEVHDEGVVAGRIADPGRRYALAEIDGTLAGYCQLVLRDGFDPPSEAAFPVTLSQLYCAAGTTGKGVGGALMHWALAEARACGADEIRLSVWAENFGAQRFYARYGFKKIADIGFWVGSHRDDEFLYSLKL